MPSPFYLNYTIMIEINRCEIVGGELIIDVMIPNYEWYKDVEIGSIIIDSDETYSESGPSSTPLFEQEFDTLYQRMLDMQEEMDDDDDIHNPEFNDESAGDPEMQEEDDDSDEEEEDDSDDDDRVAGDSDDVDDSTAMPDVSDDANTEIEMEDDDEE